MCESSSRPGLLALVQATGGGPVSTPASASIEPAAYGLTPVAVPDERDLASAAAREQAAGSRRRRLWELEGHAHCPVIGVCLPIAALRRLVNKVLDGQAMADDYELHCGVITDCRLRTSVAEAVQRELDRRYAIALRQSGKVKTTEALAGWWDAAVGGQEIGAALWATLTHPRCTPELTQQVLGRVHMLQHQAGMAARVDLDRFEALIDENAVIGRELAQAQQRATRLGLEQARRLAQQQAEIVQLGSQLIARDARIAQLDEELAALEAAAPALKTRFELARTVQLQLERLQELERSLLQARQEAERQRRRADELAGELQRRPSEVPEALALDDGPIGPTPQLGDRAVLCVGGRTAAVPLYRHIVERVGGRFLHHDGGEEDSSAKLDATLAAADLVICQTGCISHNAYWRVKDHCKRTGKQCVFVETPSTAGLKRALIALAPVIEVASTGA